MRKLARLGKNNLSILIVKKRGLYSLNVLL